MVWSQGSAWVSRHHVRRAYRLGATEVILVSSVTVTRKEPRKEMLTNPTSSHLPTVLLTRTQLMKTLTNLPLSKSTCAS